MVSVLAVCGSFVCMAPGAIAADKSAANSPLIDIIVAGMKDNHSRLPPLEATIETRGDLTPRTPGDGDDDWETLPVLYRETVILKGDLIRHETHSPTGLLQRVFTLRGNVWTEYDPAEKTAWVRRPDQMGGVLPLDPRGIGLQEFDATYEDVLVESEIVEARIIQAAPSGGEFARVVIKQEQRTVTIDFSAERSFLPVAVVYRFRDGTVNMYTSLTYQKVPNNAGYFVDSAVRKFFPIGTTTSEMSDEWNQIAQMRITDMQLASGVSDERFVQSRLPGGTRILDSIDKRVTVVPHEELSGRQRLYWIVLPVLACVAGLLVMRWLKRRDRDTMKLL